MFLPAGTTFVSATSSVGQCSESDGEVVCRLGTLASGASATVQIVVTADSAGSITLEALATADQTDVDASNNEVEAVVTVLPSADLALTINTVSTVVNQSNLAFALAPQCCSRFPHPSPPSRR